MKPMIILTSQERQSPTRWGKPIKDRIAKGKPGTPKRRIEIRVGPTGAKYNWHPTKGYRPGAV